MRALHSIGGREDLRGTLFLSHPLIGVKGARPGEAIDAAGFRELHATVGRDRPLWIVLQLFNLR